MLKIMKLRKIKKTKKIKKIKKLRKKIVHRNDISNVKSFFCQ